MSKSGTLIAIVLFIVFALPLQAQPSSVVNLAAMHDWDIVLDQNAIPSEKHAAQEFQQFFSQASGIKLPLVHRINRPDRHVFIGPSQAMRSSNVGFGVDDFGDEDLRIIVRDGNIAIAGGRPRGSLYGVYTFLGDYLGVRFLTADHTHVPGVGHRRVVGPVDYFYHPPLRFRSAHAGELNFNADFSARMRNNFIHPGYAKLQAKHGGSSSWRLINHSFDGLVPPGKHWADHPEYYGLVDEKRMAGQLCLTNPEVLKIAVETVRQWLDNRPEYKNVSVSQNDNDKYCRCPNCAATDKREGTQMGSQLTFVKAVADEIAKTHPDVCVGTLAYWYTRRPPKTIKPGPNVQIMLATYECSVLTPINDPKSKYNRPFCRDLVAWGKISKNIMIWNYNTNFRCYLWPAPNMRIIEPNIRFFVANNARGIFMQAAGNTIGGELSDIRNYVTCRLLWNPKLSGQQLMDEFLDLHYGKAAPPIRWFLKLIHDKAEPIRDRGNSPPPPNTPKKFGIDEQVTQKGLKAFERAMRLADDETVLARVEKVAICAYALAITHAYEYADRLHWKAETGPMPADLARQTRPYAKRLFELVQKHGVTQWRENLSIEAARNQLRLAYGLKEDEPL